MAQSAEMTVDEWAQQGTRGVLRALLLGFGAAIAWVILSLFAPTTSASAHELPVPDGGVLGIVHEAVHATVAVADQTVSAVAEVMPVLQPATSPVSATVNSAQSIVATASDAAAAVVQSAPVSAVTNPVLEVVGDLAAAVPVVGDVVDASGAIGVVSDTTQAVDAAVITVVSGPCPVLGIIPPLLDDPPAVVSVLTDTAPAGDVVPAALLDVDHKLPTVSLVADRSPAGAVGVGEADGLAAWAPEQPTNSHKTPPAGPANSPTSGGTASSGGTSAPPLIALGSSSPFGVPGNHHTSSSVDDDLPVSPVFSTDSTPD
jgi:hypothetical protein